MVWTVTMQVDTLLNRQDPWHLPLPAVLSLAELVWLWCLGRLHNTQTFSVYSPAASCRKSLTVFQLHKYVMGEGFRKREPDPSQWYPVRNRLKLKKLHLNIRKNFFFSLWGRSNTGASCPKGLWNFHLWRYSKHDRTQLWPTCSSWPCCKQVVRTKWSLEVPANPNHSMILW